MVAVTCGPLSARSVGVSTTPLLRRTPLPGAKPGFCTPRGQTSSPGRSVVVKAEELDFDGFLMKVADEFEKVDNKPVVIGYGVLALFSLIFAEWAIHLPVLDILVGFPVQLLGVVMAPYLAFRYFVDKEDWYGDTKAFIGKIAGLLPGLKKN